MYIRARILNTREQIVEKINWEFTQRKSDVILSDGLFKLINQPYHSFTEIGHNGVGNYLISTNKKNYYVGEGANLEKRLKQQFNPRTSTFYKNLLRSPTLTSPGEILSIDSFKVQSILTYIGRKEIEEYGIANLTTGLNRFQLNKRRTYKIEDNSGIWDHVQKLKDVLLAEAEQRILNDKFSLWFDCKVNPNAGLYLIKNNLDQLIYIGESSDINERFNTHCKRTYFSALRRHIGTDLLNFSLKEKNGKKKYFEESEDKSVTEFLKSCKAIFHPVNFGRYEVEEYLIKKYRPVLNRKNNKVGERMS